ncbi:hypothetical protein PR048_005960 [Dryococelus australis]|uniref:Uncharacterized protein n=1 Tax=Dryococelus australis TaxID=614101 RepID=A0ABQ9I9N6_9NEOP|nr:hypothetical protein PR048_005960 [Dryococelus australis]
MPDFQGEIRPLTLLVKRDENGVALDPGDVVGDYGIQHIRESAHRVNDSSIGSLICHQLGPVMRQVIVLQIASECRRLCMRSRSELTCSHVVTGGQHFAASSCVFYEIDSMTNTNGIGVRTGCVHADPIDQKTGFLGVLPFTPSFNSGEAPYSSRFTLIGIQDLDVKSRPNLFTHSLTAPFHCVDTNGYTFKEFETSVHNQLRNGHPATSVNDENIVKAETWLKEGREFLEFEQSGCHIVLCDFSVLTTLQKAATATIYTDSQEMVCYLCSRIHHWKRCIGHGYVDPAHNTVPEGGLDQAPWIVWEASARVSKCLSGSLPLTIVTSFEFSYSVSNDPIVTETWCHDDTTIQAAAVTVRVISLPTPDITSSCNTTSARFSNLQDMGNIDKMRRPLRSALSCCERLSRPFLFWSVSKATIAAMAPHYPATTTMHEFIQHNKSNLLPESPVGSVCRVSACLVGSCGMILIRVQFHSLLTCHACATRAAGLRVCLATNVSFVYALLEATILVGNHHIGRHNPFAILQTNDHDFDPITLMTLKTKTREKYVKVSKHNTLQTYTTMLDAEYLDLHPMTFNDLENTTPRKKFIKDSKNNTLQTATAILDAEYLNIDP